MIKDARGEKYGVSNVVGDLHSAEVPTAINRTVLEYRQLHLSLSSLHIPMSHTACEFGCGYGRMLPFLQERSKQAFGVERDAELRAIAQSLNPDVPITDFQKVRENQFFFDMILTYTFLQHLFLDEFKDITALIVSRLKRGGYLVAVEEYYDRYSFPEKQLKFIGECDRVKEATNPRGNVGKVMIFQKITSL